MQGQAPAMHDAERGRGERVPVAACLCGREVVRLCSLLLLLEAAHRQTGAALDARKPEQASLPFGEDCAACILMPENPAHPDRARHMDVKGHFLPKTWCVNGSQGAELGGYAERGICTDTTPASPDPLSAQ